jgi:hypothetical protein
MRPVPLVTYRIALGPDGVAADPWTRLKDLARVQERRCPEWPDRGVFVPDGTRPPPAGSKELAVGFGSGPPLWPSDDLAPGHHDTQLRALAHKFWPTVPGYDAFPYREDMLRDLQRTDPDDSASVLAFVNRWGVLGIGTPAIQVAGRPFPFDGVADTAAWIGARRRWVEALSALQRGKPGTVGASGLDLSPAVTARYHDQPVTWPLLAQSLNRLVGSLRLAAYVSPGRQGLSPRYWIDSLADLLNVEFWKLATDGGYKLRRCPGPGCRIYFRPARSNKTYCSRRCASHAGVRADRKRKAKAARQGRTPQHTPHRGGHDGTTIRQRPRTR